GAKDRVECGALLENVWRCLVATAGHQGSLLTEEAAGRRFLALLTDGFASKRAYLEDMHGDCPDDADAWGWDRIARRDLANVLHYDLQRPKQGTLLGHVGEDWLYLFPEQTYQFVAKAAREGDKVFPVELGTLLKHLAEQDLIETKMEGAQ